MADLGGSLRCPVVGSRRDRLRRAVVVLSSERMAPEAVIILHRLQARFGPGLFAERRRIGAALRDVCPRRPRDNHLLLMGRSIAPSTLCAGARATSSTRAGCLADCATPPARSWSTHGPEPNLLGDRPAAHCPVRAPDTVRWSRSSGGDIMALGRE